MKERFGGTYSYTCFSRPHKVSLNCNLSGKRYATYFIPTSSLLSFAEIRTEIHSKQSRLHLKSCFCWDVTSVLIESVFCGFFSTVVFFFPGKVFFSAFFSSNVFFFTMMGKIIVYTATCHNFLLGPNYFASLHSAY